MADMAGARRAAGVLIHRGAEWLLLRNARAGHWGFAKGHLEEGEGDLPGALREVREETGLLPRLDPAFVEVLRYEVPATKKRPAGMKEVVYFLGSVPAGAQVAASEEHDGVEWLPVAKACERLEHDQLRRLLERAERFRLSRVATTS